MLRIRHSNQFRFALSARPVARTAHFALHRMPLDSRPDDIAPPPFAGTQSWIGALIPKRWARRAVTRNAIRRQIYAVSGSVEAALVPAAHVVRLRSGFANAQFPSATSSALKQAVRVELLQLFGQGGKP